MFKNKIFFNLLFLLFFLANITDAAGTKGIENTEAPQKTECKCSKNHMKFAYLDMEKVFAESDAKKALDQDINSEMEKIRNEAKAGEDSLESEHKGIIKLQNDLESNKENYSSEKIATIKAENDANLNKLKDKYQEFSQKYRNLSNEVETKRNKGMASINDQVFLMSKVILVKEGYSFIVPKFFFVSSDENIVKDITSQIIEDLNKSLPKLSDSNVKQTQDNSVKQIQEETKK